jgi:putative DNA primase/helicase
MNSASNEIVISLFKNSRDNTPKTYATNWHDLQKFFGHRVERPEKDGPAWSPAIYPDGASRSNQNVEALQLAVLDIDNGFPVESMLDKLNTLGLSGYCHSSHSHSPAKNKYRVVLPLNRTVKASEWSPVWNGVNAMMGGVLDAAAKDAARLYYRPSKPPGAEGHFFHAIEGLPVDVDRIIADAKRDAEVATKKEFPLKSCQREAGTGTKQMETYVSGTQHNVQPEQGLKEVIKRCSFISYFSLPEHQNSISEPLWMAGITNTCVFENSDEFIHRASDHHDEYDELPRRQNSCRVT